MSKRQRQCMRVALLYIPLLIRPFYGTLTLNRIPLSPECTLLLCVCMHESNTIVVLSIPQSALNRAISILYCIHVQSEPLHTSLLIPQAEES